MSQPTTKRQYKKKQAVEIIYDKLTPEEQYNYDLYTAEESRRKAREAKASLRKAFNNDFEYFAHCKRQREDAAKWKDYNDSKHAKILYEEYKKTGNATFEEFYKIYKRRNHKPKDMWGDRERQ